MNRWTRWLAWRAHQQIRRAPYGLARLAHSDLMSWKQEQVSRGLAIGLFWAFVPMPFQMAPAALFCWLTRANLPLALAGVWISNPFTYVPIFYAAYRVGAFFTGVIPDPMPSSIGNYLSARASPFLLGCLIFSCTAMTVGYFIGYPLAKIVESGRNARETLRRIKRKKRAKSQ